MTSFANVYPLCSSSNAKKVDLKQVARFELIFSSLKNLNMRCFQTNGGQEF